MQYYMESKNPDPLVSASIGESGKVGGVHKQTMPSNFEPVTGQSSSRVAIDPPLWSDMLQRLQIFFSHKATSTLSKDREN